ncbi:hypothetical protein E2562_029696 [Oryza meyeriana var. granulata]|uniref:Disease resistance protein At4g27190-like leucine-rich repeats domain-containing protein n=1 Tax=Oryza meyeriana var. granulata TaxID=110450 RepID=A0A6G1C0V0_9ORYZ|nr:hypothetical protein E2562_029696 [Oryza meyeriana var. granulata]
MREENVIWRTFDQAVQGILKDFVENQSDTRVIYFNGWRGFGASAVLRAVADELTSRRACPELRLDKVIHIDCSTWKSRRAMQRAIAVELNLDASVIAIIDKADEEDDFSGLDEGSRGEIISVANVIDRALRDSRFMVIFHNGGGDYIDLGSFGFPQFEVFRANLMLWTFRRRFQGREDYSEIKKKVNNTHFFAYETVYDITRSELLFPVLQKEATAIAANYPGMREIDSERIVHCCLYGLFLYLCLPKHLENDSSARASTYWMCDDIIQGDRAWEISSVLSKEIKWDLQPSLLDEVRGGLVESSSDNSICFERFKDTYFNGHKTSYPWIIITASKNVEVQDMRVIDAKSSSYFLAPAKGYNIPIVLADGLFNQSTNLHVLQLSHCVFSFTSPPFIGCQKLRFLGLDHCKDNETTKQIDPRKWQFLHSLRVLGLIYTDWYQVFSKEIAHLIINLAELNIVGPECWQCIGQLQGQLPDIHKLILDGCGGPENIVSDGLPLSLRSFSFDGYGPASKWTSTVELPTRDLRPDGHIEKHIKTSTISLKGCTGLENLFIRQLPNLVELDLSGTAIKILNFTTMVVEVPNLKRIFLLGCEQLRAIKWDLSGSEIKPNLELLCIDTRPGIEHPRPSFDDKNKSFRLQVHAVIVDARLARSLWDPIDNREHYDDCSFSIHITSSTVYSGVDEPEGTCKDNIVQQSDQVSLQQQLVWVGQYHDVLSKVGDTPMESFPQPPSKKLSRHIEIAQGCHSLESELDPNASIPNLAYLLIDMAQSLHVHDISTSASMPGGGRDWERLKWCHIERCQGMEMVFPTDTLDFWQLETMWVSDLLMARWLWSKGSDSSYDSLRHLYLRCCPRLQFMLPVWASSFPNLEILHVIHCRDLHNIFVLDEYYPEKIAFPKLTTVYLHDLPMLRQICDVEFKMMAPALKTIKIRGCWSLRRLPTVDADGPKPTVEIEKDVWDALEWDGVDAGHHPSLFQAPLHSRYYKKQLPRGSVLR